MGRWRFCIEQSVVLASPRINDILVLEGCDSGRKLVLAERPTRNVLSVQADDRNVFAKDQMCEAIMILLTKVIMATQLQLSIAVPLFGESVIVAVASLTWPSPSECLLALF